MADKADLSGWRRRVVAWALGVKASSLPANISLSLADPKNWMPGGGSASGKHVDDETAMKISAVWACNKILSEAIGMFPLHMYRKDGSGNSVRVDDHKVAQVVGWIPNRDMTSQEFLEAGQLNLGKRGNAYSLIERRSGEVTSLYPIAANKVTVSVQDDGSLEYKVSDRGRTEKYPREKIWHVKGMGDGVVGLSVIAAARETFGMALAAEDFEARFFRNGAQPSAVVSYPGWIPDDKRDQARDNINRLLGGGENAHKVHVLEGGMKLEPWGMPLDDAQFLELRLFGVRDICRFYGIPPHMVADTEAQPRSNLEQTAQEFLDYGLMPWLKRWENGARRWLLRPTDQDRYFFRFNVDALLRGDSQARQQFLASMVQNGIMTRNEARAKENLGRSDEAGMDSHTVQVNLAPITSLPGTNADPQAQAQ